MIAVGTEVTIDDFITGLVAGLAKRGRKVVSIRHTNFYDAVLKAFESFSSEARDEGLEVDFSLGRSTAHGDSPDVRNGLTRAVQDDLISLDNPTYQKMRGQISVEMADEYLKRLPGGPALYERLTTVFLKEYRTTS